MTKKSIFGTFSPPSHVHSNGALLKSTLTYKLWDFSFLGVKIMFRLTVRQNFPILQNTVNKKFRGVHRSGKIDGVT